MTREGHHDPGLYVCGWLRRGPSGIIGESCCSPASLSSIMHNMRLEIYLHFRLSLCSGTASLKSKFPTGTNLADAEIVVDAIAHDIRDKAPQQQHVEEEEPNLLNLLQGRGVKIFSFSDWLQLDAAEVEQGALSGKARQKCVSIPLMLAHGGSDPVQYN